MKDPAFRNACLFGDCTGESGDRDHEIGPPEYESLDPTQPAG